MATITISKTELLSHLHSVSKIIPTKSTLPILTCIRFTSQDDTLIITGAGEIGQVKTRLINAKISGDIKICIEAKDLVDALKTLPEQPITISINDKLRVRIEYQGGKFDLVGLDANDFPCFKDIQKPVEASIPVDIFLKGIDSTMICIAANDLRPILNAVFIEFGNGQINYVATDTRTLALSEYKNELFNQAHSFSLPKEIADVLKTMCNIKEDSSIKLTIGSNNVRLEFGECDIIYRAIEGRFPNYRSVIPTSNDKKIIINTNALKNSISRVFVFSEQESRMIKLKLTKDLLQITTENTMYEKSAEDSVSCLYDGPSFEIGLNASNILQVLKSIDSSDIEITFSSETTPVLIYPINNSDKSKQTYLIAPVKLQN